MTQTKLTAKKVAAIGEEVGLELGTQMVKSYQQANPSDVRSYLIGRNIIDQILAQPGCVGIKFYNAYNENGGKTLVYLGVDQNGTSIVEYKVVSGNGQLDSIAGIVADRIKSPNESRPRTSITEGDEWWAFD